MMNGFAFGFGGMFMMVFWVLFSVFVVGGAFWLISAFNRSQGRIGDGASSALRILEERLARGEIDAEEFRIRRTAIEGPAR